MTLEQLIKTPTYNFNKSRLSRHLGVNRKTIDKYMADTEGSLHFVVKQDGYYSLFVRVGDK